MLQESYFVDRIVGGVAVLMRDDNQRTSIPLSRLPSGVKKGAVLRVSLDNVGTPSWPSAEFDDAEAKRRAQKAEPPSEAKEKREADD